MFRSVKDLELFRLEIIHRQGLIFPVLIGHEIETGPVRFPGDTAIEAGDVRLEEGRESPRRDIEQMEIVAILATGFRDDDLLLARTPVSGEEPEPSLEDLFVGFCFQIDDADVEIPAVSLRGRVSQIAGVIGKFARHDEGLIGRADDVFRAAILGDVFEIDPFIALRVRTIEQVGAGRGPLMTVDGVAESELARPASFRVNDPELGFARGGNLEGQVLAVRGQVRLDDAAHLEQADDVWRLRAGKARVGRCGHGDVVRIGPGFLSMGADGRNQAPDENGEPCERHSAPSAVINDQ